jgi:hypothetical protein
MRSSGICQAQRRGKGRRDRETGKEAMVPPIDIAAIEGLKELEKLEFYNKRVINIDALAGLPKAQGSQHLHD